MEIITINGVEYVKKSDVKINEMAKDLDWMPYVMVRTYSAWVFAWYLEKRKGKEVKLRNARRMWSWEWAASLSQLATDWTTKPSQCKFPCEVDYVELTEVIEILPITEKAKNSIASVKVWEL